MMNPILKTIGTTFYNWREIWLWPLIAYINLKLLCLVSYLTTGHWPQESLDALVGLGMNLLLVTLAISATSIFKESLDRWWPQDKLEKLADTSPRFAIAILWSGMIGKVAVFIAVLWGLKR